LAYILKEDDDDDDEELRILCAVKTYLRSGGIAPRILNFGSGWS